MLSDFGCNSTIIDDNSLKVDVRQSPSDENVIFPTEQMQSNVIRANHWRGNFVTIV